MFGYIIVNKPELRVREFDEYMAYYCGLCHTLKDEYGLRGQISLSYDLTFLAIFLTGLYEPDSHKVPSKCVFHPFEKRSRIENEMLRYTADMNLLLTYYKCRDDWEDERKADRAAYGALLKKAYRKIREKYPVKCAEIEMQFALLAKAEERREDDIDRLAGCFGRILAEVFVYREDEWKDEVRQIGFMLGRFIYILDAYDDLKKDEKKGAFNPFLKKCKNPGFDEWIRDILTLAASSCAREFEKLPIIENIEILRNILYSGIWTKYEMIISGKNGAQMSPAPADSEEEV